MKLVVDIEHYGESNPDRRKRLLAECFAFDATLADPPVDASGHDGIDAMFSAVQKQFPEHTFRRVSQVDAHHQAARFEWELVAPDGTVSVGGIDFARVAPDGKLHSVVGFFGPTSPRNDALACL